MADGGAVKQFAEEVVQEVGEVVEEVKDEVGQALEQGAQSVVGTQLTPQQIQQKQAEEQKQLTETRRKIAFYQRTAKEQAIIRQENKQKETQRLQAQQQEKQVTQIQKEEKKKQPINPATFYAGKAEFKRGVGG